MGHVFIIADIAWVSISSWKIEEYASSEVTLNDSGSCKAACLAYTGCLSVGWTQATGHCSLHEQTRLQVGMLGWKRSSGDQYFEFYFTPLGENTHKSYKVMGVSLAILIFHYNKVWGVCNPRPQNEIMWWAITRIPLTQGISIHQQVEFERSFGVCW